MKKRAVLFCLSTILVLSTASAQTWFAGSLDEALAQAKAQGKLLLLDFFASSG